MKRLVFCFLLSLLLCHEVRGAEVSGAVALTFDGYSPQVAETLDSLGAKGTFFLSNPMPEATARLTAAGHEIGLDLSGSGDMTGLSRRQIYGELHPLEKDIPKKNRPLWIRPPEKWGDGFRQVAEVTRHGLLRWSLDARSGLTGPQLDQIRSGDVIALGDISAEELSDLIGILRGRNLEPVTVTELAGKQDVEILPGKVYEKFPVRRTGNFDVGITCPRCSDHPPARWGCRRWSCPWRRAECSCLPER